MCTPAEASSIPELWGDQAHAAAELRFHIKSNNYFDGLSELHKVPL